MKINKKTRRIKKLTIPIIALLLIATGYGAYAATTHLWPFTKQQSSQTEDTKKTDATKDDSTNNSSKQNTDTEPTADTSANPKTPTQSTPDDPVKDAEGSKSNLTVTITHIGDTGSKIQVRTNIEDITSDGSCALAISDGSGVAVTKTSGIQALPNSSTCKGFDIDKSELGSGKWTFKVIVTIDDKTGTASKAYTVK